MLDISKKILYYKRKEIQEAIVQSAKDKEVGIRFKYGFGKRPDILVYPNDVLSSIKKGATSFHVSEERWSNVMQLSTDMNNAELNQLRMGWDLVLDIDCPYWSLSKLVAYLFIKSLKLHNINCISCKFSGNKGFHIGVPFESFPKKINNNSVESLFPEGPKRVALYLLSFISNNLIDIKDTGEIIFDKKYKSTVENIKKLTGSNNNKFDPLSIVQVDTILISSRHMYRAPYSMHEKSGLVSLPIDPDAVMDFEKSSADPVNVNVNNFKFLDSDCVENESMQLLINAFDYNIEESIYNDYYDRKLTKSKNFELPDSAIPLEYFPPSIKKGLMGIKDGKKRFLFILINFLRTSGWTYPMIEDLVKKWNVKNPEPLKQNYLQGQLRYIKLNKKIVPPPNYSSGIYRDLGIEDAQNIISKYKNPVMYARVLYEQNRGKKRTKLTDKQKEMRRKYRQTQKNKKILSNKSSNEEKTT